MRRARTGRTWFGLVLVAGLVVAAALALIEVAGDPVRALQRRTGPVIAVLREPALELGPRVERWRIVLARGDTVRALWRSAPPATVRPWTVVLMGGLNTGDRAALLLPDDTPTHALAVDWPWGGPRRMSALRFVASLPAIREALLRSPGVLAAGLDAAARAEEADPERIVVLGASLGAPIALAALRVSNRARALVLIDGGAGLEVLLRAEAMRYAPAWVARAVAPVAAWLVRPIEPERNTQAAAGLPTLLLNARDDERLPAGVVERLHELLPHAEVRWRETEHIRPHRSEMIEAMTREVVGWLAEREPPEAS